MPLTQYNSGTDPSTSWKTLNKLNNFNFSPGDKILFNRNDTWYGSLSVSKDGSAGNPITYGAYGSGAKPIITGLTTVTAWTNLGGNIWESTNTISTLPTLNVVLINGVITPMGRYPNRDASYPFFPNFLKYESVSGTGVKNVTITSSSLSRSLNWTGAEVCVFVNQWTIDRSVITSHTGGSLSFANNTTSPIAAGWGFFIQNDAKTLDVQNEWYYNPGTKKLRVYSTSMPANVMISTVENTFYCYPRKYIAVDNLDFRGGNNNGIYAYSSSNISLTNCSVTYTGFEGMFITGSSSYIRVDNCYISDCGASGIYSYDSSPNYTLTNNTIKRIGLVSSYKENDYSTAAIQSYGPNSIINKNIIDSSAAYGIQFRGSNTQVRNNFINWSTLLKGDAGGIYTGHAGETGKVIDGNIILNTFGNPLGKKENDRFVFGIYSDDLGTDMQLTNNTIFGVNNSALYLHNSNNMTVRGNTVYNSGGAEATWGNGAIGIEGAGVFPNSIFNNVVKDNIVFSTTASQYAITFYAAGTNNDLAHFGIIDSNYFTKIGGGNIIRNQNVNISLAAWRTVSGFDIHTQSVKTVNSTDSIRLEYNASDNPVTIVLDQKYIDSKGVVYNGSITLQPWRSAVLIKEGPLSENIIIGAGDDQEIELPTNNISLSGNIIQGSEMINSYEWKKISGGNATIVNSSNISTAITGLFEGLYVFELVAKNKYGATASSTVRVKVNKAPNKLPTANAGTDKSITLPENAISLTGSGKDADGTIVKYQWTKKSGPVNYQFANVTAATAEVSKLVQGVYLFELTVSDNEGATASSTVQVIVNKALNKTPTVNAGGNQSITLPENKVSLKGSGNDTDGTIIKYQWTKKTGPSDFNIVGASSSVTEVNSLKEGIYIFELTATDNEGATASSTMQVIVNKAPNKTPTANAGANQSITLPENKVSLNGSGKDDDGTIVNYEGTKKSGPANYEFTGTDETIILPSNSIAFNNGERVKDENQLTYKWAKKSGPTYGKIIDPNSTSTAVTDLVEGVYLFELTVTGENGSSATATVQITVERSVPGTLLPAVNPSNIVNGIDYDYYEGSFSVMPDVSKLTSVKKGTNDNYDLSVANRTEYYAIYFTGYIDVPTDGKYTFYTASDDGSMLYIDNVPVVNNDGLHGAQERSGIIGLKAGKHSIIVGYFQGSGGKMFSVNYEGPGISKQVIPSTVLYRVTAESLLPAVKPSNLVKGLDYNYYEGSFSMMPDVTKLTSVQTGTNANFDLSVANKAEFYALNFTGYIDVPSDGKYTFYTNSDDGSMLYIDNVPVVNNDGLHGSQEKSGTIGLKAGKHAINVGYFQASGGKMFSVKYEGPGISKQVIPSSVLYRVTTESLLPGVTPSNLLNGLDYSYYEGKFSTMPDVSNIPSVKKGSIADFDLSVANKAEYYAVDFTGYIDIPTDGKYTFYTSSDDGSMLYIDNVLVVNNDGLHGEQERSGIIGLKAGKHAITVDFFQGSGYKTLKVNYEGPGILKQSIPSKVLYHVSSAPTINLLPSVNPISVENGQDYKYVEGNNYTRIPAFSNPLKTGTSNYFDLSLANRAEMFALNFTGYIEVPADGVYTFYTSSDDGSSLYIDHMPVVNNDGLHGWEERFGVVGLKAGKHYISVEFFQGAGGKSLQVSYEGPGISKMPIPASVLYRNRTSMAIGSMKIGGEALASTQPLKEQSLNSLGAISVKAYPNPFINSVVVTLNGEAGDYSLQMMDALGRTLWTRKGSKNQGFYQQTLNTSSLQKGIYFLKVTQNEKSSIIKLLK